MRKKKIYQIDDILPIRLTEKAGATDEAIDYINSLEAGEVGQTLIKALKFWIRTQDTTAHERIRNAIEDEARVMNMHLGRYGQNRGPYKKAGESEEVRELKEQLKKTRERQRKNKSAPSPTPSKVHIVDEEKKIENQAPLVAKYFDAEDELYGGGNVQEQPIGNPMLKALNSIPKRG